MIDPVTQIEKVAFLEVVAKMLFAEQPEDARFKPFFEEFQEVVRKVVANPKKSEVDPIYSDFSEMCRHSPLSMRKKISAELQRSVGRPISYFEKARLARIDRIVARGKIRTDDEWRLVEERIQELSEEDNPAGCDVLDRLLWKYKPKKGPI